MWVGHWRGIMRVELAWQEAISQQHANGDEVIDHRRPGARTKDILGIKDGLEEGEEAVEKDLRQQQEGQGSCLYGIGLGIFRQHHPG